MLSSKSNNGHVLLSLCAVCMFGCIRACSFRIHAEWSLFVLQSKLDSFLLLLLIRVVYSMLFFFLLLFSSRYYHRYRASLKRKILHTIVWTNTTNMLVVTWSTFYLVCVFSLFQIKTAHIFRNNFCARKLLRNASCACRFSNQFRFSHFYWNWISHLIVCIIWLFRSNLNAVSLHLTYCYVVVQKNTP